MNIKIDNFRGDAFHNRAMDVCAGGLLINGQKARPWINRLNQPELTYSPTCEKKDGKVSCFYRLDLEASVKNNLTENDARYLSRPKKMQEKIANQAQTKPVPNGAIETFYQIFCPVYPAAAKILEEYKPK